MSQISAFLARRSLLLPLKAIVMACLSLPMSLPAQALTFFTEDNPPLNYPVEGKVTGVASSVVTEMAKRAKVDADIQLLPWTESYSRALSESDACVFSTARTNARNNQFQWIGSIARGYWSAFSLDGFSERIAKVSELKNYRIGVVRDARADHLRQEGFTRVIEMERDRDIPAKLTLDGGKSGGVDLWITQGYAARELAAQSGIKVKEVFSALMSQDYWLACNLKVPRETVRALSSALNDMKKDGTHRKLTNLPPAGN
jgi:polar amino acid transport system substrate-binding protein